MNRLMHALAQSQSVSLVHNSLLTHLVVTHLVVHNSLHRHFEEPLLAEWRRVLLEKKGRLSVDEVLESVAQLRECGGESVDWELMARLSLHHLCRYDKLIHWTNVN